VEVVAGVDLGGTAINYTLVNREERFLIEGLCEHSALSKQGPEICLQQIADGLKFAADQAGVALEDVVAIGLDTPGPASAAGLLSARGSTNFAHPKWAGFDIREGLAHKLGMPVSYLNDANAAALWGHYSIFGANSRETSVSDVVGTGNGGGIILDGNVVKGKNGFGGELGHVLIPYQSIAGIAGIKPHCNCGRIGDLESLCSLTDTAPDDQGIRVEGIHHFVEKQSQGMGLNPKNFFAHGITLIREPANEFGRLMGSQLRQLVIRILLETIRQKSLLDRGKRAERLEVADSSTIAVWLDPGDASDALVRN
jgi:predicted NBD/HSP70 family sugar kinase